MDQDRLAAVQSGFTMLSRGRKLRNILDVLGSHRERHRHLHTYLNDSTDSENGEGVENDGDGEGGEDGEGVEDGEDGEDSSSILSDDDFAVNFDNASEDEEEIEITTENDTSVMNNDETDSVDEEDASTLAKVDTKMVHKDLDIPEMAKLIHQVCAERKQPDRELTVVHYVAVDQVTDLDNLCNAIELSHSELPCCHTLVQQCVEGGVLLQNNTSRLSVMLQLLFHADKNDVVIFEHVNFNVNSNLDPDDHRSLAYSFNGEHNQLKQQKYLSTRGDIVMCNAVFKELESKQNAENWRRKWTKMKERQKTQELSNWDDWGTARDWYSPERKICLVVQTLFCALQKSPDADKFLDNVLYNNDNMDHIAEPLDDLQGKIEEKLSEYESVLRPRIGRFVSEFNDICPTFEDAVYEIDDIDNYGKKITVSFADYRDTVSVFQQFLQKKIVAKSKGQACFLELFTLQDENNKPKFDINNDDDVKSFFVMCYKKTAWFQKNHQRLLQARYTLKRYCKNNSWFKSWAKWVLFVVEQIIVISNFAQAAWETLDHSEDAEKTIAFKEMPFLTPERKLFGDFRKALLQTADALFPAAEGETLSAMGAFKSIEAGLKDEVKLLRDRLKFQVGDKRRKSRKKKAGRQPKQKKSKRKREDGVMNMEDVFNIDKQPPSTSKKRKKGKKTKGKQKKKKKKRAK